MTYSHSAISISGQGIEMYSFQILYESDKKKSIPTKNPKTSFHLIYTGILIYIYIYSGRSVKLLSFFAASDFDYTISEFRLKKLDAGAAAGGHLKRHHSKGVKEAQIRWGGGTC